MIDDVVVEVMDVASEDWTTALQVAKEEGFAYPDHLTAIDRLDHLEVVVLLRTPEGADQRLLRTSVPADTPELVCSCALFPGLAWHEREAAEMFGLRFVGSADHPPLLTRTPGNPLRKSVALRARMETQWPGAVGARRAKVPGVSALWEEHE